MYPKKTPTAKDTQTDNQYLRQQRVLDSTSFASSTPQLSHLCLGLAAQVVPPELPLVPLLLRRHLSRGDANQRNRNQQIGLKQPFQSTEQFNP